MMDLPPSEVRKRRMMKKSTRMFLAIDGGILASEAALLTASGEVLAWAAGDGVSPQEVGVERSVDGVRRLRDAALAAAKLPENAPIERIVTFMAGVDLPAQREMMREALRDVFPESELTVENDIHAVLWAGLRRPAGVAIICGTGVNALARSAVGRTAGYLALGTISGDWGGSLSLGREILFAASRAEDGRGPQTSLRYQVAAHFTRPTVRDAVAELHLRGSVSQSLADLSPLLFEAEANGDAVARALVDRLATEITTMASAAVARARFPSSGSDVVLAGSILTAGHARLDMLLDTQLAAALPGAAVHRLAVPNVVGAALAALGAEHGGPVAGERRVAAVAAALAAARESHAADVTTS